MSDKLRILWHSNAPWTHTGYANQTSLFVPRIKALGHEVAITAFWGLQGGMIHWNGIPIYPNGAHPYGVDVAAAHAAHFQADILLTLIDAWVIDPNALTGGVKYVPWFPVDMEPLPPPVLNSVKRAYKRIVFSRFGERMVNDAGLDCYYVPHGIDTNLFQPRDRKESRQLTGLPADRFIVSMVAANKGTPSRKAYPEQLQAFAEFHKRHPDAFLYLHTSRGERGENGGVNLPEIIRYLGITDSVAFCDQYANLLGFPDEYMANVYAASDVLLSVSMGEGFGIPIVEAQAAGCPVIVGDWTSMSELCFGGYRVPKSEADPWWTPLAAYQYMPRVGAIVDGLEWAWKHAGHDSNRRKARKGALEYDADRVARDYWRPVLADIAEKVDAWKVAA
jgi:glycosyltransferase involved in cell wall biosynthesis